MIDYISSKIANREHEERVQAHLLAQAFNGQQQLASQGGFPNKLGTCSAPWVPASPPSDCG